VDVASLVGGDVLTPVQPGDGMDETVQARFRYYRWGYEIWADRIGCGHHHGHASLPELCCFAIRRNWRARSGEGPERVELVLRRLLAGVDASVEGRLPQPISEAQQGPRVSAPVRLEHTSATLEATVQNLMGTLGRLPEVLGAGKPEERKAVARAFLAGIRIDKATRRAILRWYRLPRLDDVSVKLVELRGFEPLTPRLPALCSPS
jgi:hypothetical protein